MSEKRGIDINENLGYNSSMNKLRVSFLAWRLRTLVRWRNFQIRQLEKWIPRLLTYHNLLVMEKVAAETPERYEREDLDRYDRESNR